MSQFPMILLVGPNLKHSLFQSEQTDITYANMATPQPPPFNNEKLDPRTHNMEPRLSSRMSSTRASRGVSLSGFALRGWLSKTWKCWRQALDVGWFSPVGYSECLYQICLRLPGWVRPCESGRNPTPDRLPDYSNKKATKSPPSTKQMIFMSSGST